MRRFALVTGGNRGIGRAIVCELAQRGFDIALVDLQEDGDTAITVDTARASGAAVVCIPGDIGDIEQHERILQAANAFAGPLLTLVNNAGVSAPVRGDVLDVEPEHFDTVMDVNLRGTFFFTQAVARRMLADAASESHRSIITVTSASADIVSPDRAAYCCSKTALSMMVKVFAIRLATAGIGCYELRPGIIRTAMTQGVSDKYDALIGQGLLPMPRWGTAADVGRAAAVLAGGELTYVTGDAIHVDGGLHIHRL